jgi:ubiquinone/menaquinone biosynthesis C-methylase UbiE
MAPDNSLRHTFDEVALLYDEARPRYPDALFSTLVEVTRIHNGSKLLEIGPGTGLATRPLADRGFDITAIELGPALAEFTKQALRNYRNVRVIKGAFEEVTLPATAFELVFAATSFHWIDPAVKFAKPHRLLKDRGHLAIIQTNHISDEKGDRAFLRRSKG